MFDIIPDIHGQADKLTARLTQLGYAKRYGAWRHPDAERTCIFLGDFIDRGPKNAEVIDIIRHMIDAGTAMAVMGNHELNAIQFHTVDPENGLPLRPHSHKNLKQHASFLKEFPIGSDPTSEAINWMKSLPLFLESYGFRFVHACWDEDVVSRLAKVTINGRLSDDQFIEAGKIGEALHGLVETTTKGPESELPEGYSFVDEGGNLRREVRLQWWNGDARTWRDMALSVPDPTELPNLDLPAHIRPSVYAEDAHPVFFGHYWLSGEPEQQSRNALCLDYSAGKDGPLVAYRTSELGERIDLANIVVD
ncbi:metallophosphoesterase [Rhodovulum sp. YNF3179]|uniref:metallophosphoesterase n=1 Tax=Rhodovulum sp. YNF3179 TaxID=3425127 RepID=UPI003D32623B